MKRPMAIPVAKTSASEMPARPPRAFGVTEFADLPATIDSLSDPQPDPEAIAPPLPKSSWLARIVWATGGALASLALGLAADRLIRDLFAATPWLGWIGLGLLGLFVVALVAVIVREAASLARLSVLDRLKARAAEAIAADNLKSAKGVVAALKEIYVARPDLSRAMARIDQADDQLFDGGEIVKHAERVLMAPLDARARALTAASARRVALVTAVSPRALVDIAFVVFESVRLGGAVARLYGARPGLFGTWRLIGAILGHLAVTGGLVLTDGVIEQLVGQGLAARLSQRLGEGIVNGLMTVRVGIAAMRVVRPLPFTTEAQPAVRDFLPELASVLKTKAEK